MPHRPWGTIDEDDAVKLTVKPELLHGGQCFFLMSVDVEIAAEYDNMIEPGRRHRRATASAVALLSALLGTAESRRPDQWGQGEQRFTILHKGMLINASDDMLSEKEKARMEMKRNVHGGDHGHWLVSLAPP